MQATKTPPALNQEKIDLCVETLSLKGCAVVTRIIAALERGETVTDTQDVSADERQAILAELKSVMAVYQRRK